MPRMGDATRNALISGVWAVFALHPSRIAPVTGHATVKETGRHLCGPFRATAAAWARTSGRRGLSPSCRGPSAPQPCSGHGAVAQAPWAKGTAR